MDLTSAIVGFDQASLTSQIQIAVAGKMLDQQRANGNAAIQLLDAAEQNFDGKSDTLAAAATGLGANLDVTG